MNPLTFCIVGRAGAGKTYFIERLIPHLTSTGLKIATFKQSKRPLHLEYPLSDGARLSSAGTERSVVFTPNGMMVFPGHNASLEEALEVAGLGCDVLLVEGRIMGSHPVIEIVRAGLPVFEDSEVWLSVSFKPTGRQLEVPNEATAAGEIIRRVAQERTVAACGI